MELIFWLFVLGLYTYLVLVESASANPLQEKTEEKEAHHDS